MTEVFTAKTVEEAKAQAAKKFGKKVNEIKFKVLEEGKKGFLGIGQVDAKVEATYVAPAPKPEAKPVVKAEAPKEEPKAEAPKEEPKAEAPEEEPKAETPEEEPTAETPEEEPTAETPEEEPTAETPEEEPKAEAPEEEPKAETPEEEPKVEAPEEEPKAEIPEEEPKAEAPKAEPKKPETKDSEDEEVDFTLDDFTLIEDESLLNEKVKIARDYITSVLRAMDIEAEFVVYQNETGAVINIESNNNGTIIGRRGETLDSLQYLCSIIANKGDKDYFRITIDCLGYRNKRKDTLQQLAAKVAKSVIKSGRSQQLEPMNPYERRVIHSAISEIDGVSSRSVGEEPYRKIIISSDNPKRGGKRKGQRRDDRKGNNRRNDRNRKREPMEVKAIDLSTSFEKDYKKPKPEDSMEGGLYGKIEF